MCILHLFIFIQDSISVINSTFYSWGCGVVAGNTGISLHNRGNGFTLESGHFNCIEPGKRPLHTIIPAMVYRDARPVLCFGVMGGQYQSTGHARFFSNLADFGISFYGRTFVLLSPTFYGLICPSLCDNNLLLGSVLDVRACSSEHLPMGILICHGLGCCPGAWGGLQIGFGTALAALCGSWKPHCRGCTRNTREGFPAFPEIHGEVPKAPLGFCIAVNALWISRKFLPEC